MTTTAPAPPKEKNENWRTQCLVTWCWRWLLRRSNWDHIAVHMLDTECRHLVAVAQASGDHDVVAGKILSLEFGLFQIFQWSNRIVSFKLRLADLTSGSAGLILALISVGLWTMIKNVFKRISPFTLIIYIDWRYRINKEFYQITETIRM